MTMADGLMAGRLAPAQGSTHEARSKDDANAGAMAAGEDGFKDVMSDLAERAEGASAEQNEGGEASRRDVVARIAMEVDTEGDTLDMDACVAERADAGDVASQLLSVLQPAPSTGSAPVVTAVLPALVPTSQSMPSQVEPTADLASLPRRESAAARVGWALASLPASGDAAQSVQLPSSQAAPATGISMPGAVAAGTEEVPLAHMLPTQVLDTVYARGTETPAELKVTVLGNETHLAPVKSGAQVVDRLLAGKADQPEGEVGPAPSSENTDGDGASLRTEVRATTPALATGAPAAAGTDARGERGSSDRDRRMPDAEVPAVAGERAIARAGTQVAAGLQVAALSADGDAAADLSPAVQIARRIAADLAGTVDGAPSTTQGTSGAVKVLHLQLEPAHLGTVTVRVAIKDNAVTLHLEAARHETAFAIERDRELLSSTLKAAGYAVDGIVAQPADPMRTGTPQAAAVAADAQLSSSLQDQSQAQAGLPNRRNPDEAARHGDFDFTPAGPVNEPRGGASRTSGGALYV